jgi:hypothetical protein
MNPTAQPLRFVLDEHLRRILWGAIQSHNATTPFPIDAIRIGDPPDLPRGTLDPDLLVWAEREQRLILTRDRRTMPGHLARHLAAGRHSPGVLCPRRIKLDDIIDFLACIAYASHPDDWLDNFTFIP